MVQGLIYLILKPSKGLLYLNNWHPKTLLNSDYKILAPPFAKRLKLCLTEIMSTTQSGLILIILHSDILDDPELFDNKSLILFLDFYKAFDTAEHFFFFTFEALQLFGFEENFRNIICTLYTNINSCVSLAHGTSPRFSINQKNKTRMPYLRVLICTCC